MRINDDIIYIGDNGRAYCGAHLGMTARHTGRDLSGQEVYAITPEDVRYMRDSGMEPITCEQCGKAPSALVLP